MSVRTPYSLGELYEVHNGLSKASKFFGTGYPFIAFKDVFNNYFIPKTPSGLVQSTPKEQESYSVKRGDILITRTSETHDELGMSSVALIDYPHATYNGFTKRLRPITDLVFPEFIGYYLRAPFFRVEFQQFSSMTTRASLKNEELLNMRVLLPSMKEQKRLAAILMAYDNLIENNRRQIALLEEAAQRLYKEWFVDLRFPGYEDVEIINDLPASWSKSPLTDCANVIRGRSYKSSEIEGDEGVVLVNLKNLRSFGGWNDGAEKIYSGAFKNEQHVQVGDIIMGVTDMTKERRLVGHVALVPDLGRKAIISMDLVKLVPYQMEPLYLYSVLRFSGIAENIALLANGTNVLHLKPQILSSVNIDEPPMKLQADYARHIAPMMNEINLATRTIARLSEARDRLLPKLMSGEVEVGNFADDVCTIPNSAVSIAKSR